MIKLNDIDKVLTICFYGRSGSVFFQSLLDSHPNILTIPGTYISGFGPFWEHEAIGLKKEDLIDAFIYRHDVMFNVKSSRETYFGQPYNGITLNFDSMGENKDECLGINKDTFRKYLNKVLENQEHVTRKDFFRAIHIAYYYSLGRTYESDTKPIIVFQLHAPSKVNAMFLKDFLDVTYIFMIRNPVQSLISHIKHYVETYGVKSDDILYLIKDIISGGVPVFEEDRERTYSIKLEDLHKNSKLVLKRVCKLLNIEWNDILMESTFDGLKWWNLKGAPQVNGFGDKIISKKHEDALNSFDRFRLEVVLKKKHNSWKYIWHGFDEFNIIYNLLGYPFKFEELMEFDSYDDKLKFRNELSEFLKQQYKFNQYFNLEFDENIKLLDY